MGKKRKNERAELKTESGVVITKRRGLVQKQMKKFFVIILPITFSLVGLLLVVAGCIRFSRVSFTPGAGFEIAAPGETSVSITKPGNYILWNEIEPVSNGQHVAFPEQMPSGNVTVLKQPEKIQIAMHASDVGSAEVEMNGEKSSKSFALGEFSFDTSGVYQFQVGGFTDNRTFRLNESIDFRPFERGILAGVIGMLFIVAAIVSLILGLFLSSKNRNSRKVDGIV